MSRLDDVGARDGWRCWLCDEPVDPQMSVNDARGPSVDTLAAIKSAKLAKSGGSQSAFGSERLAHRACNTRKGAVAAVVPWPPQLFVIDPAPIIGTVERLHRKGGRDIIARCPTFTDGQDAAAWLLGRVARLCPELSCITTVEPGGGQFMVVIQA